MEATPGLLMTSYKNTPYSFDFKNIKGVANQLADWVCLCSFGPIEYQEYKSMK